MKWSRAVKLLCQEPGAPVESSADLLGIALALEQEAVRRYRQLASLMEDRGAVETAATFRALMEEERHHVASVSSVLAGLIGHVPDADRRSSRWRRCRRCCPISPNGPGTKRFCWKRNGCLASPSDMRFRSLNYQGLNGYADRASTCAGHTSKTPAQPPQHRDIGDLDLHPHHVDSMRSQA
jgi:hypothetical protein